jgi:hypothetical protein
MTTFFVCLWCQKEFPWEERTKEHLVPQSIGGKTNVENIKFACRCCNNERGRLTSHYGNYRYLMNKIRKRPNINHRLQKWIRRYNTRAIKIKELFDYWVRLEINRLGYAPSLKIPFVWEIKLCDELSTVEPLTHQPMDTIG